MWGKAFCVAACVLALYCCFRKDDESEQDDEQDIEQQRPLLRHPQYHRPKQYQQHPHLYQQSQQYQHPQQPRQHPQQCQHSQQHQHPQQSRQPKPQQPLPPPPPPSKSTLNAQSSSQLGQSQHQTQKNDQAARPVPRRQSVSNPNQLNPDYLSWRERANQEQKLKTKCIEERRRARGDRRKMRDLSQQCEEHQNNIDIFNKRASDWIFAETNKNRSYREVDLHGLYVKEAIAHTDEAIAEAKKQGASELRLIVGKGLHSTDGEAKIRPAIETHIQRHLMSVDLDPGNAGVLVVRFHSTGDDTRGKPRVGKRSKRGKKSKRVP